ncbi:ATP-binding cassette sub-family C member 3-like [Oppia nitens]|uniref:ATP-binding cassette sub-family C member 3-like n=1 Tax=Oppia nitens TaxID=1686743 RepID=UPI0023DB2975|nr:ATP-binding cassette sub-family C member 3-like [Oppia nitens]
MVFKGYKTSLTTNDMWELKNTNKTNYVIEKFNKVFIPMTEKKWKPKDETLSININILTALLKTFWANILFVGFLKLIGTLMLFANPLILDLLIEYMTPNNNDPNWRGYFYATLMFISPMIESIFNSQYEYYNSVMGMNMRSCVISVVYKKNLKLSNTGRKSYTTGEIVNLMAIDSQRIMDFLPMIHVLWSAPTQIGIAMFLLWQQLGIATLAGLAFMLLLLPTNTLIAAKMKAIGNRVMKMKDKRVKLMNEILSGIKVFKLYSWETSFKDQVTDLRENEVKSLFTMAYISGAMSFTFIAAPFFVALFSFTTFLMISSDNILDANKAFVSLSLFNIMRLPLGFLPHLLSFGALFLVSVRRINEYLNANEIDENCITRHNNTETPIVMENSSFQWSNNSPTVLKNVNLRVKRNKLVAVVGQVGSGKSSLLAALLGELEKLNGIVNVSGSVAYVPQEAWIQNSTLRQNILFTSSYNEKFYKKVLETCAMEPDLKILSAGDMTEIGEKGINISGGQKQRVSLARAVYANADIYLMDDPLSAVDAHVGRHLFDKVIGPHGILKHKTRILVTHKASVLTNVDQIVVLKNGSISECGTFEELVANKGDFAEFVAEYILQQSEDDINDEELNIIQQLRERVQPFIERSISKISEFSDRSDIRRQFSTQRSTSVTSSKSRTTEQSNQELTQKPKIKDQKPNRGRLIEAEMAETGSVKFEVYKQYFQMIGFGLIGIVLSVNVCANGATIASGLWLTNWANDALDPQKINDSGLRDMRLGVYAAIGIIETIFSLSSHLLISLSCIRAAKLLHNKMLFRILRAPMAFFDTTPTGRILNRFSKDVDTADMNLLFNIRMIFNTFFRTVVSFILISLESPIILVAIMPLAVMYYLVQRIYISTSRQLKRIDSTSRSPIYTHFSETVNGSTSIRAFGATDEFIQESNNRIDANHCCYYPSFTAGRWLAIRLEFLGYCIVFLTAIFAVLSRDTLSPGIAGLAISYSMTVTSVLSMLITSMTNLETNIVAIERIIEYTTTPVEADLFNEDTKPEDDWPNQGVIKFNNYSTRYREGLDLVLNNITLNVKSSEKVGIVGRTGAGKSSLTLALFRLIEPVDGNISIDNIDISKLGLNDLRSKLTIIPQDPALFTGTLRINLDPFNQYTDSQLWRAIESAHLKSFVESLDNGLNYQIAEGGENLSVGQKQLVCLARALLRRSKVLVLDEATAAVDMETDDLIQETIKKEFSLSTIVTIAHRLNTIIDYDRILVMDKGMVAEFDSPNNLLAKPDSIFFSMAKEANLVTK